MVLAYLPFERARGQSHLRVTELGQRPWRCRRDGGRMIWPQHQAGGRQRTVFEYGPSRWIEIAAHRDACSGEILSILRPARAACHDNNGPWGEGP